MLSKPYFHTMTSQRENMEQFHIFTRCRRWSSWSLIESVELFNHEIFNNTKRICMKYMIGLLVKMPLKQGIFIQDWICSRLTEWLSRWKWLRSCDVNILFYFFYIEVHPLKSSDNNRTAERILYHPRYTLKLKIELSCWTEAGAPDLYNYV